MVLSGIINIPRNCHTSWYNKKGRIVHPKLCLKSTGWCLTLLRRRCQAKQNRDSWLKVYYDILLSFFAPNRGWRINRDLDAKSCQTVPKQICSICRRYLTSEPVNRFYPTLQVLSSPKTKVNLWQITPLPDGRLQRQ